jgi:hypothetical protein
MAPVKPHQLAGAFCSVALIVFELEVASAQQTHNEG